MDIPVAFQVATLLAAFAHPDHLLFVSSRGLAYLPPRSNLKSFGYNLFHVFIPAWSEQRAVQVQQRQLLVRRANAGSVLLISLVMLLVITVAGLTAVKMATLEEKMSGNYQDQQMAFYAAEAALKEAENFIASNDLALSGFNMSCGDGYCFSGSDIDDVGSCDPGVSEPWQGGSVWSDSGQHRVTMVSISGVSAQAKYIIEFRCYIAKESQGPLPDPANRGDWALYYRITALATGGSSDSRVMLQSSFKKNS